MKSLVAALAFVFSAIAANGQVDTSSLFRQLTIPESSKAAASTLQLRASEDSAVHLQLEQKLPSLLQNCNDLTSWESEMELAGKAQVLSTIPILTGYIRDSVGLPMIHTMTAGKTQRGDAPASALVLIGDPAVPSLSAILTNGEESSKTRAALILKRIGTPTAQQALDRYLVTIKDSAKKQYIEQP